MKHILVNCLLNFNSYVSLLLSQAMARMGIRLQANSY